MPNGIKLPAVNFIRYNRTAVDIQRQIARGTFANRHGEFDAVAILKRCYSMKRIVITENIRNPASRKIIDFKRNRSGIDFYDSVIWRYYCIIGRNIFAII